MKRHLNSVSPKTPLSPDFGPVKQKFTFHMVAPDPAKIKPIAAGFCFFPSKMSSFYRGVFGKFSRLGQFVGGYPRSLPFLYTVLPVPASAGKGGWLSSFPVCRPPDSILQNYSFCLLPAVKGRASARASGAGRGPVLCILFAAFRSALGLQQADLAVNLGNHPVGQAGSPRRAVLQHTVHIGLVG